MSTPTKYVEALEKENAKSSFPSKYGDFLNEDRSEGVNQGLYSFRPSFKKHIKDASYQYYSFANQFAHKVIDLNVTQEQADKFVKSSEQLLDQISIMQGSEILVGPKRLSIAQDHEYRLQRAQDNATTLAKQILDQKLSASGIYLKEGAKSLYHCIGTSNDTVQDCPVARANKSDFLVTLQNSYTKPFSQMVRVLLPH